MSATWLADLNNQQDLYTICRALTLEFAAKEEPLFEELFPEYVRLLQQGEVSIGTRPDNAFGFAGGGELLILAIIPAVTTLLGALLASHSAARFAEIKEAQQEVFAQETRELAEQYLPKDLPRESAAELILQKLRSSPSRPKTS